MEQKELLERLLTEKLMRRAFELRRLKHKPVEDAEEFRSAVAADPIDEFLRQAVDENSRLTDIVRARINASPT